MVLTCKHSAMFDRRGTWRFVYSLEGVVRMLITCLFSSSYGMYAVYKFDCNWVGV